MALSGTFYGGTVANGYRLEIDWSATQNISANTSTITSKVYIKSLGSGYDLYVTRSGSSTIDGSSASFSAASNLAGNGRTLLYTHTRTVSHSPDGTKSAGISASYTVNISLGGGGYVGTLSASGTANLNTIPRASSLTGGQSWTAANNTTFSISRASSSFTHSIMIYVNNVHIKTLTGVGTSISSSFTVAQNTTIFNQLAQAASKSTKITLITYSGGTEIGRKDYTGTCTAPAASLIRSTTDRYRYVDEDFPVEISVGHSSFTHTLRWTFGSFSKTITGVGSSHTWDPTPDEEQQIYAQIKNAKNGWGGLSVTSYYNGVQVRTATSVTFEWHVRNSEPIFSIIDYYDNNAAMVALTGSNQWIVQNKSYLIGRVLNGNKATAQNQASITHYIATVNGESITINAPFSTDILFDFSTINAASNQNLTITAFDSRGFSTSVVKTVNVAAWSPPVMKSTAKRTNGFLNETTLTLSGSISPVYANGANRNGLIAADVKYRYRKVGAAWGAYASFLGQTLTMPNYSADSVLLNGSTGLDNTSAWEVEVVVTDKFGNNTLVHSVGTGQPILHIDDVKKSVGVGKFPSISRGMDIAGSLFIGGGTEFSEFNASRVIGSETLEARLMIATPDNSVRLERRSNGVSSGTIEIMPNGVTKLSNGNGNISIGALNSTWLHIDTDRSGIYFYKPIVTANDVTINGVLRPDKIIPTTYLTMPNNKPINTTMVDGSSRRSLHRGTDDDLHINADAFGKTVVWASASNITALQIVGKIEIAGEGMEIVWSGNTPYIDYKMATTRDYDVRTVCSSDGSYSLVFNGQGTKHRFYPNGTKTGGSIEIDGENLGMSPIDSPQVLFEYIEFNIPLDSSGVKLMIDERFLKSVDYKFAVFPNNGDIVEKGLDYFIIRGVGVADVRIIGERIGYENMFYDDLSYADEELTFTKNVEAGS